jgi:hypothetical protein
LVTWNWYHQHARVFDCQHICYVLWTWFATYSRHTYGYKLRLFSPISLIASIPLSLKKKDATDTDRYASYLDLHLDIDSEGWVRTKLYYKRDYFNFPIVNFPFTCSNIPAAPAYGVYISQLIWYSRDCGSYQDFLNRGLLQTGKLLNQGFLLVKLKSSLRKFYDRHHDLVDHYRIYVSQMATDIFHLS